MSDWSIRVPVRDPDDPISDVVVDAFSLQPEERDVVHELASEAILSGCQTTGDLLQSLTGASVGERRTMLDNARAAAGLETATAIDDEATFNRHQDAARRRSSGRDAAGNVLQGCAAEGCAAMPIGPTGMPEPVADRCWWCPEHRHLAGPDDHLPPDDVATMDPNFMLIPPPSTQRAMQAEDERHRAEHERRVRDRQAEAEAIRIARERYYEQHKDDPYVNPLSGAGWAAP